LLPDGVIRTSGAKAQSVLVINVAAEAATHKAHFARRLAPIDIVILMTLIVVARVSRRGVFLVIGKQNLASEEASYKAKSFPIGFHSAIYRLRQPSSEEV